MYAIQTENLSHIYNKKSPFEVCAIEDVTLQIKKGEIAGVVGHTGSGKSTLVQHFNMLLKPSSGAIFVDGIDAMKKANLASIRKKIGLVFQYPEYQIFEETVEKDIAFGPQQLSFQPEEVQDAVKNACLSVGLDFETFKNRSPFELSGGEKRKVAIAGVIAMKPEIIIFDEPTSGLDPASREELVENICLLSKESGMTVILISHSMELICRICTTVFVMHDGRLEKTGPPEDVFSDVGLLKSTNLNVPVWVELAHELKRHGFNFSGIPADMRAFAEEFKKAAEKK